MMTALTDLQQMVHQAQADAREAREYSRMARARAIRTQQEVQRAHRWTLMAYMALSMPTASAWTRDITATILANHGLLDETPPIRPPRGGTRRSA
jgi:uncharacterized membrane protein